MNELRVPFPMSSNAAIDGRPSYDSATAAGPAPALGAGPRPSTD